MSTTVILPEETQHAIAALPLTYCCSECACPMDASHTLAGEPSLTCSRCGREVMRSVAIYACTVCAGADPLQLPPIAVLAAVAAELSDAAREAADLTSMRSIDKATLQLHAGTAPVVTVGGYLLESKTRPGLVHRFSNVAGCGCEAGRNGKACWHASLIEIVEVAAQRYTMPDLRRPVYAEALVPACDLYA